MDYTKRETINASLRELEAEGIVTLVWPKYREQVEVTRIYIELDAIDRAYQLTGVTPRNTKITTLRAIMSQLLTHPWNWVASWAQSTDTLLRIRKSAGLDLDTLEVYDGLVRVLLALPLLTESIPRRVFSQRVLGDSKAFEQLLEKPLLRLLRENGPEEYATDEEYLDSVNIVTHPKLTLLAGQLEFALNGAVVTLSAFPGGMGLYQQSIKTLSIISLPTAPILIVENLTTYYQALQQQASAWGLIVYAGGFPHSGTKQLLGKLSALINSKNPAVEISHWGDIDYGGIRIFEHLKETFFPSLRPYLMDTLTYFNHADQGIEFDEKYAEKLGSLLQADSYREWHPLLLEMLTRKIRVEQESITPL